MCEASCSAPPQPQLTVHNPVRFPQQGAAISVLTKARIQLLPASAVGLAWALQSYLPIFQPT